MRLTVLRGGLAITFASALLFGIPPWGGGQAQAQMAQPAPDGDGLVQTPYGLRRGVPVQALPGPFSHGGSCVAWCAADLSPCDPDYWKVADRRCNPNQSGYF